jgi:hypothetical protein
LILVTATTAASRFATNTIAPAEKVGLSSERLERIGETIQRGSMQDVSPELSTW